MLVCCGINFATIQKDGFVEPDIRTASKLGGSCRTSEKIFGGIYIKHSR
jgi:hypothetical protein